MVTPRNRKSRGLCENMNGGAASGRGQEKRKTGVEMD